VILITFDENHYKTGRNCCFSYIPCYLKPQILPYVEETKRWLIMQKEDFSILKQVVLFALLAIVLGFAYG
jgi:hypothetical protein